MKKNGVNERRNRIKKGILKVMLAACVAFSMAFALDFSESSVVMADEVGNSGNDGGIHWGIDTSTSTLSITVNAEADEADRGVMNDYAGIEAPWNSAPGYSSVCNIVVEDGVKNIGGCAFNSSRESKKTFNNIVIKSDVAKIGKYAFANSIIKNLSIYGFRNTQSGLDATAFVSATEDGNNLIVNIEQVNCYSGLSEYFTLFKTTDIPASEEDTRNVQKNENIVINAYNVVISSTNLLGSNDKAYATYDGAGEMLADMDGRNYPSDSVLRNFMNNYDVSRLKLFDIEKSDTNSPVDSVKIRIPIGSSWGQTDKVKVLSYSVSENGTASIIEVGETAISEDDGVNYISFTTDKYGVYALYYDYNENPQTEISITTDFFQGVFQWNINNGSATLATPTSAAATEAYNKFVSVNDSKYKLDAVHLRVFDISAKIDGVEQSSKIENLKVKVPVPSEWESYASSVKVITIKDANTIEEVEGVEVKTVDGKKYLEFTPPHFSPYALYYANAGETPTTQPTTSAQQPTTSNGNGNNNNNNSTTSYTQATTKAPGGGLDNTPNTGVKDVMWILIPAATMLLGVGIVVLARRKKNINDNY